MRGPCGGGDLQDLPGVSSAPRSGVHDYETLIFNFPSRRDFAVGCPE